MFTPRHTIGSKCNIALPWLLSFLFSGMVMVLHAQTREDLEQNKQTIEREIRLINQMLQETKKTAEISLNHLVMINSQINSRESLIRTINNEIRLINHRMESLNNNIETLANELEELKESYAVMVRQAYRNRDATQKLMFIFSSRSFNQAFLRMRYLQQYARHRQLQAQKIEDTTAELNERRSTLQSERNRQQQLLVQQRQELESLAEEKTTQNQTVTQLRSRERELVQRLREQELAARELQRAIERVIAEERRRAQEQARADGRVTTDMFALTPEEQLLSDNFAENQGRLLWPVERGIITSSFGEQPHPVLRGIKINNNGVEISATQGSTARAIFEGVVSRVITIPGGNFAVIIRHGEYLTVYSNLSEVFVRNGDRVSLRQELGVIATEAKDSKTHMNLQIWKGSDKLNPELWIARQR